LAGTIAAVLATNAARQGAEVPLSLDDLAFIASTGVLLHSLAAGIVAEEGPFPALEVARNLGKAFQLLDI
jgi:NAD(P)H-hydrate repair Nnr-like enzyme with NAD(P)H-hydrate dehydratase domain